MPPLVAIAGVGPDYLRLTAHLSAARARVLLGNRDDVADLLAARALAELGHGTAHRARHLP